LVESKKFGEIYKDKDSVKEMAAMITEQAVCSKN
jgi:hypothetical protein